MALSETVNPTEEEVEVVEKAVLAALERNYGDTVRLSSGNLAVGLSLGAQTVGHALSVLEDSDTPPHPPFRINRVSPGRGRTIAWEVRR